MAMGAHGEAIHTTLTRKKRGQEAGRVMYSQGPAPDPLLPGTLVPKGSTTSPDSVTSWGPSTQNTVGAHLRFKPNCNFKFSYHMTFPGKTGTNTHSIQIQQHQQSYPSSTW